MGRLRMPKRPQFGFKGGSASAEKRLMHKQMLDDWDAIRAALPEVDAQFIKDTWEKLANDRVHLRSPERSSQTIACICDLLREARKRSRAFAISWEKLANDRVHLRSPGRSSQTIACICDLLREARKRSRAFAIS